jgi:adenine-specific DNA-methyltransferase
MCEKYFLHYNIKVKQFREEISKEDNFKKLSLNKQKELFIRMLDLNQLYVNLSDMEDKKYNLSKEDIAITKDFYQI